MTPIIHSSSIQKVLERLLLKGHIVVKKAYCDFERGKAFKRDLHEAASNSSKSPTCGSPARIPPTSAWSSTRWTCYTKGHVDTFVIISGDSDFSPLVSKLRENAKTVIGVGVKNSTSDLFINNCDEFIYYDDLVRAGATPGATPRPARPAASEARAEGEQRGLRWSKALDLVVKTLEAITQERERGRAHLGIHDQAGDQAPQPRFQ